jgi:hypothetical protein
MSQPPPGQFRHHPDVRPPSDARQANTFVPPDSGSGHGPYPRTHSGGYPLPPPPSQYSNSSSPSSPPTSRTSPEYSHSQHVPPSSAQRLPPINPNAVYRSPTVPDLRTSQAPQRPTSSYSEDRPVSDYSPSYSPTTSASASPILNPTIPDVNSHHPQHLPGHHRNNTYPYNTPVSHPPPSAISIPHGAARQNYQNMTMLSPPPLHHSYTYPSSYPPSSYFPPQDNRVVSHQPSFTQLRPISELPSQHPEKAPSHNNTASAGPLEHPRPRANSANAAHHQSSGIESLHHGVENLALSDPYNELPRRVSPQPQQPPRQPIRAPTLVVHAEEPKIKETTWTWIRDNFAGIHKKNARLGRGQFGTVYEVSNLKCIY